MSQQYALKHDLGTKQKPHQFHITITDSTHKALAAGELPEWDVRIIPENTDMSDAQSIIDLFKE